jgi:hypothetical protein
VVIWLKEVYGMLLVPMEGQWSRIGRVSYRRRIQRLAREITFRPFPADADDRVYRAGNRDQKGD